MATAKSEAAPTGGTDQEPVTFPSLAWFEALVNVMRRNQARYKHLGYTDCVMQCTVTDGDAGKPWSVRLTFDTYEVTAVALANPAREELTDFALEAPLAIWKAVIESTARNHGKPDPELTLNYLSLREPLFAVTAGDQLKRDYFFRYNQTLQQFINDSQHLATRFA
ncbi:MAG: hypothetical protein EXR08_08030 [Alphaproteobacteria bacterium]|nr:hypothetical protein [Alphaproteobacteria bacterium]